MRFEILGPLRVRAGDGEVAVAGRERVLLAVLLLHANQAVPVARLVDAIWADTPPSNARNQVQVCVSRLRKALSAAGAPGRTIISTEAAGYRLNGDAVSIDLLEFHQLLEDARAAAAQNHGSAARAGFRAALALWRGPAAGVESDAVGKVLVALEEGRGRALEECIAVELALGAAGELVAELTQLVAEHPYRESLHGALMVALFRAGRQADALATYQTARRLLVEEVGTEPGAELRMLQQRILAGDATLLASAPDAGSGAVSAQRVLPRGVADFTGRHDAVHRLLKAARAGTGAVTVVAVDGMAGIGKTTLVTHVAHLLAEEYPDAQLFIDLHGHSERRPVEPAAALDSLLRQLGIPGGRIPAGGEERAALLRNELANRRALLVLDNAASTAQVVPLLPAGRGCLVLVTSRRRLVGLDAARPLSLAPLSSDEAIALLAQIAGERIRDDPVAATDVVHRCGHLPLAIRLAGARLAHRPNWRIGDLADRLRGAGRLLTELAVEDRSVADAFELSYEPLPPELQRVFRLLGVLPGREFDTFATAALVAASLPDAQRALDELVDRNLIEEVRPGRFRMHDLVSEYAHQLTSTTESTTDRTGAVARLLNFYLHTAARLTAPLEETDLRPDTQSITAQRPELVSEAAAAGTAWLEVERPNLIAAVRAALQLGLDRYAWRLTRATWRFLYLGVYTDDLMQTHGDGLAAAERQGDTAAIATMLNYLASAYHQLGACDIALTHLQRALGLWQELGNMAEEARIYMNISSVLQRLGRLEEVVQSSERALAIRQELGYLDGIQVSLSNVGPCYTLLGRFEDALTCSRLSLLLTRKTGAPFARARTLGNLGVTRFRLGHHGVALLLLNAGARLGREVGDVHELAECLSAIGCVHRERGNCGEAMARHREALSLAEEAGDRPAECQVRNDLGATLRATGDLTGALEQHRTALAVAQRISFKYEHARALDGIAACLAMTEPADARRYWERAHRLYQEMGVPEQAEVERRLDTLPATRPSGSDGTSSGALPG